jgi:hypothetical protein
MIILNSNTENQLVLSLSEKVTINNPYYLFRFVHKETKNEYICLAAAIENYTHNRQLFEITTVNTTPDPLAGELELIYGDEYNYYIYAQTSSSNVDYTLSDELIQEGIMKYNKAVDSRQTYERNSNTRKSYIR